MTGCLVPSDATNVLGLAPALGPLAPNGGITETHLSCWQSWSQQSPDLGPPLPLTQDPGVVFELRRRFGKRWTSRFEHPTWSAAERFKSTAE